MFQCIIQHRNGLIYNAPELKHVFPGNIFMTIIFDKTKIEMREIFERLNISTLYGPHSPLLLPHRYICFILCILQLEKLVLFEDQLKNSVNYYEINVTNRVTFNLVSIYFSINHAFQCLVRTIINSP